MTRYELRNPKGERWPRSPVFDSATEAVVWAVENMVPVDFWPYPVKEGVA